MQGSKSQHSTGSWLQPPDQGSQESVVQRSRSSQLTLRPEQMPLRQRSPSVQGLPSSQVLQLPMLGHAVAPPPQVPFEHRPPSEQGIGVPPHWPERQASAMVQGSPSSHGPPSEPMSYLHVPETQRPTEQSLPSCEQLTDSPWQTPFRQTSFLVHPLPSSQAAPGGDGRC